MTRLDSYNEYRTVGISLNTALTRTLDRKAILESAETLGIDVEGDQILYDTETDMEIHMDFALNDYRPDGRTAVERYRDAERWESSVERALLDALVEAKTSLFEVTDTDADAKLLEVDDCLGSETSIELTDSALSTSASPGILLFARRVGLPELEMTSGIALPFPGDAEQRLRSNYESLREKIDASDEAATRFAAFYRLYQTDGIQLFTV